MMRWHDRCQSQTPAHVKVIAMTTTQPRYPFTRWIDAPLAAIRYRNWDPTGLGETVSRSSRFPHAAT
jgi:hypothetical protein